jgi:ribonuclease G
MNKEMIISSNGHETRVAILEDDLVAEIFVERERNRGVVGNVYKGRVSKVLPGMQSSFVDIGLERDGFLYVSDVVSPADLFDDEEDDDDGQDKGPEKSKRGGRGRGESRGAAQVRSERVEGRIEDLLKEGQEILVQVAKEPLGTKGARLTSHVTLPGRFVVLIPTVDHNGGSRKISSPEERGRLRGIVREFREQHSLSGGVIIRTAAEERYKEDIRAAQQYL